MILDYSQNNFKLVFEITEAGSVILVDNWYQVRHDLATFIYEELVTTG